MDVIALAALKKTKDLSQTIESLGTVINFKGIVAASSALPLSNNKKGDFYISSGDGAEWIWVLESSYGTLAGYEQFGTVNMTDLSNKLDKDQGTENAGKFMTVGSDGIIQATSMSIWQGGNY